MSTRFFCVSENVLAFFPTSLKFKDDSKCEKIAESLTSLLLNLEVTYKTPYEQSTCNTVAQIKAVHDMNGSPVYGPQTKT